ncbi:MAG: hypothetical protein A3C80_00135 [Candidatus Ryanbacteria bacterium RIFCSPHIGHO2_02_FULL_45_43]|uniref:Uncharacterized protein n=1 Tax=Candidatus Ryanbacteria bacterium RIFCSPHIGHO2_01_45_13 TaxID=1802112 RepID=A0A1G2G1K6_9BACT|nr:MAG: hypothetical protein A2718_01520 [Candidatus Ryanbacteria bacterium RIFCSPHIGHO2_01_FULL_44_130]OGZ43750.1 MAG: hypothetical protein A2W41_04640 [Candidatus Ryanbacteria bacterium RIFCSPHIGHO2_01_45_13]OGZ47692.1 MAG: hypothetical protein A3C80_00135 [Candidatus Ryanbacteria bacterium RIFCSPHIGHO2_02_FULL_45_43]OGZ49588.1 MAG: hypothetical protein A3E55_04135 [Candidatus Ryanbacteria bacterium RIFCSPHIGHO2_12_FULL_44_20]OGZ51270.1 MAG: hypothetical protein A3A17_04460 [Candidatus Ryanba
MYQQVRSALVVIILATVGILALGGIYFYQNKAEQVKTRRIETLRETLEREAKTGVDGQILPDDFPTPAPDHREAGKNENSGKEIVIPPVSEPLNHLKIREIIAKSVQWFKEAQEQSGHFRYEYAPFMNIYGSDDNIVRQSGALYILGEVFIRDHNNRYTLKDTLENAISYFTERTAEGELDGTTFLCITDGGNNRCTLGTSGLALVGILDLIKKHPELESQYRPLIGGYASYILAMKKPNEGFRGYYYFAGDQTASESPFSNGEAFLALVRYYENYPSDEVKTVIDDAFDYFNTQYRQQWDGNFYLWGMMAIKDLYRENLKQQYVDFVKEYTDWRISGHKSKRLSDHNRCAYIEGVISAYSVLEPVINDDEKQYYIEEINFWLSQSSNLQVKEHDTLDIHAGGERTVLKIKNPERAVGGFLTGLGNPLQRIDFTQHCLSSYLQKLVDIDKEAL